MVEAIEEMEKYKAELEMQIEFASDSNDAALISELKTKLLKVDRYISLIKKDFHIA